jgi:prephenate dehydrogenase
VPHWPQVTIVGVGLLGGSIGLALRRRRLAGRVVGQVRRKASIAECERAGAVDEATTDLRRAVESADLVILCTPIARMAELAREMAPALKPGALVTDVGSVKAAVVEVMEPILAGSKSVFIGSHPMAGSEKSGVSAARADLFESAVCVVTPVAASPAPQVAALEDFWSALGGVPLRLAPEAHDELVARSSHLPHVVAAELANYVLSPVHPKEQARLCATGFRDTTRIASGLPDLWRDICLANHRNLARVLGVFIEDLQEFQLALEKGDAATVEEFFAKARERRDAWNAHPASPSPE